MPAKAMTQKITRQFEAPACDAYDVSTWRMATEVHSLINRNTLITVVLRRVEIPKKL